MNLLFILCIILSIFVGYFIGRIRLRSKKDGMFIINDSNPDDPKVFLDMFVDLETLKHKKHLCIIVKKTKDDFT